MAEISSSSNHAASASSKISRWIQVVLLGLGLGLIFFLLDGVLWPLLRPEPSLQPYVLSGEPDRQAITEVINRQLEAFRKGDADAALACADSEFRSQYDRDSFASLVRAGYPAIWNAQPGSFGLVMDNGSVAAANLGLVGRRGALEHYVYLLRREHGGWRISGVLRLRTRGMAV